MVGAMDGMRSYAIQWTSILYRRSRLPVLIWPFAAFRLRTTLQALGFPSYRSFSDEDGTEDGKASTSNKDTRGDRGLRSRFY
jgi:hypothetical protein